MVESPQEHAVESPSLSAFKRHVDKALRAMDWGGHGRAGLMVGLDILRGLFQAK